MELMLLDAVAVLSIAPAAACCICDVADADGSKEDALTVAVLILLVVVIVAVVTATDDDGCVDVEGDRSAGLITVMHVGRWAVLALFKQAFKVHIFVKKDFKVL